MQSLFSKFNSSRYYSSSTFTIIPETGPFQLTGKQKYSMILLSGHLFKRGNFDKQLSWKSTIPSIETVYVCSHSSYKCSSLFLHMKDGSGRLINQHSDDIKHFNDSHIIQRYNFVSFAKIQLENNPNYTSAEIITKYINQKDFNVDCFTPYKSYMSQKVSQIELNSLGKIPQKLVILIFRSSEKSILNSQ